MKAWWAHIRRWLGSYYDVTVFAVTVVVADLLWKLTIHGDEHGTDVMWLMLDVSVFFDAVTVHVTNAVYWLVSCFRDTVHLSGRYIWFDSGSSSHIVWGCSGIKQAWVWFALMLTARGPWVRKAWFIPLGWLACYAFNILRISLICLLIESHPDWFHILHNYIFKYLFYGMMFGLWVWWIAKINSSAASSARVA